MNTNISMGLAVFRHSRVLFFKFFHLLLKLTVLKGAYFDPLFQAIHVLLLTLSTNFGRHLHGKTLHY